MNDRIAEILNQPAFDRLKDWHDIGPVQKATLELFAELIVRECAKAADEGLAQVTMKVEWPSYHIKKHFGVEE